MLLGCQVICKHGSRVLTKYLFLSSVGFLQELTNAKQELLTAYSSAQLSQEQALNRIEDLETDVAEADAKNKRLEQLQDEVRNQNKVSRAIFFCRTDFPLSCVYGVLF